MIMNKIDWIFFDLDGTLVDSIDTMYKIYSDFLKYYEINGTKDEFEKLNGPSLNEIVIYLKKKYRLTNEIDELLNKYQEMIEKSYIYVKPFKESTSILKNLKEKHYKLALVSSATNKIVQRIIKRYNWSEYFSVVITGDDIKISKPFPEIYNLCVARSNANAKKILVIEDSKNGYESAIKAGLECILLNKDINLKSIMTMVK